MLQHHVIYVPGLGDDRPRIQSLVVVSWRIYGVQGHCVPMHWGDGRPFAPKIERLLKAIDGLAAQGATVSLVASSAGASAALNAYAARPESISGVVCICGKIQHPETVEKQRYEENPAFHTSMFELSKSLKLLDAAQRERILSIHPRHDPVVAVADTFIDGAHTHQLPVSGHAFSIGFALTLGAPTILRFLKTKAAQ